MADDLMEKIVSLCKRRGFIFPGSEIYGGLAGTWDYGPYGVALKRNITQLWWSMFVERRRDMYGLDAAILMNPKAWEASGHTETFADPVVVCKFCKALRRFDETKIERHTIIEDKNSQYLTDGKWRCEECDKENHGSETPGRDADQKFNLMFETKVGAGERAIKSYLRPETAGGIFVNFKNVVDTMRPKLPFGIAQIGKAFRNEIAPRDFIFRSREFEQMEIEYFVRPKEWEQSFEAWRVMVHEWITAVGVDATRVHELEVKEDDRAHYSKRTIDFEYDFPFGRKELYGLAYRTDFDLSAHAKGSGVDLSYLDPETNERFVPHVIEPSFGVDRTVLAVLASCYREDELGGESRAYLALPKTIAPVKAAVFPLLKNKPALVEKAREVYEMLKLQATSYKLPAPIAWDDNGNIGKRYRRQDEIGTPYCITIDFDTLGEGDEALKDTVTLRDRDTGKQERVKVGDLTQLIK